MDLESKNSTLDDELQKFTFLLERYLVTLVNVAYYVYFHKQNEPSVLEKQAAFKEVRDKIYVLAVETEKVGRTSWPDLGRVGLKSLMSRHFLQELCYCSHKVSDELEHIIENKVQDHDNHETPMSLETIPNHLRNCILGFVQIFHFIKKLPVQQQYRISALQLQILERELKNDLVKPWTRQVETLHSTIGWVLLSDTHFREKLNQYKLERKDQSDQPAFNLWLREEIRK
ncbi:LANO_0E15764g1_1 [Lachancea nothofagi CBS 11611]|uniref:LANO_0E15764g1_1 n=1 Tax=Lachancea nothofagi CBS 11611 TaxID=1266666 RepID=A0A1G4K199_9SACH|nr:LANO_0E15764g1_1 [Lachancea nothofagi CBS 11611]